MSGNQLELLAAQWTLVKTELIDNPLPALLKQLLMVNMGKISNSKYCQAHHAYCTFLPSGLSYKEVNAIVDGEPDPRILKKFHVTLKISSLLLSQTCRIRLSRAEVIYFIRLISAARYMSSYNGMVNVPIEKEVQEFVNRYLQ